MWFPAVGLEGRIEVTRCGRVRSVDRIVDNYPSGKRLIKGRELKCSLIKGYKAVDLRSRTKQGRVGSVYLLHRLIAITFVENTNPAEFKEVNHIDGDKQNNSFDNLEWCTKVYNHNHAWDSGLCDSQKTPVECEANGFGYYFPTMNSTNKSGFNPSLVHAALNGKQNHHKGFVWRYVNG